MDRSPAAAGRAAQRIAQGCDGSPQPRDAAGGGGVHIAAHRSEWLDRAQHGWGADVDGGGEKIINRKKRSRRGSKSQ
jgi:hypothetical protein